LVKAAPAPGKFYFICDINQAIEPQHEKADLASLPAVPLLLVLATVTHW